MPSDLQMERWADARVQGPVLFDYGRNANMSTKTKYKHGRKGVKAYKPQRPLAVEQLIVAEKAAFTNGWKKGVARGHDEAYALVFSSRNIREAKRRLEALING